MLGLSLVKDIIKILFCIGLHKKQWDIGVIIEYIRNFECTQFFLLNIFLEKYCINKIKVLNLQSFYKYGTLFVVFY